MLPPHEFEKLSRDVRHARILLIGKWLDPENYRWKTAMTMVALMTLVMTMPLALMRTMMAATL